MDREEGQTAAPDKLLTPAPAIGCRILTGVGEGRTLEISTYFARESSDDEANALLDRLRKMSDRQKAFTDLEVLEVEIFTHEARLAQTVEDEGKAELDYKRKQAGRKVERQALEDLRGAAIKEGEESFRKRNRQGEYKPKGENKNQIERADAALVKLERDEETDASERDIALQGLANTRRTLEQMLVKLRAEVEVKKALVQGPTHGAVEREDSGTGETGG